MLEKIFALQALRIRFCYFLARISQIFFAIVFFFQHFLACKKTGKDSSKRSSKLIVLIFPVVLLGISGILPWGSYEVYAVNPISLLLPEDPKFPIGIKVANWPMFSMYLPSNNQLHYREMTGHSGYLYRTDSWCVKVATILPAIDYACDQNVPINPFVEPNIGWPPQVLTFVFNLPLGWYITPIDSDVYAGTGKIVPIKGKTGDFIGIFASKASQLTSKNSPAQTISPLTSVGTAGYPLFSQKDIHSRISGSFSQNQSKTMISTSPNITSRSSAVNTQEERSTYSGTLNSTKAPVDFSKLVAVLVMQAFARCVSQEFYHLQIIANMVVMDQKLIGDNCTPHFPPILKF